MPTVQLVALLALLAVIAFGSNELSIPAPTFRYQNNPNSQGWSPKPTASARFRYPPVLDLLRRQDDVQKTCGYVNAEQSSSLTCATGYCAYDAVSYAFGCCTDVEYNTAVNSLVPGPACSYADITTCHGLGNSFTQAVTGAITCSDSAAPSCILYTFVIPGYSGYQALGCSTVAGTFTVYTTYTDDTSVTPVAFTSPPVISTPSLTPLPTPSPPRLPSSKGITTPTPDSASSGGGGGSSSNTGAIAGGAVGGVIGLAAIAGLIWFLLRRNKKNKSTPLQPSPAPYGTPAQGHDSYNPPSGGMAQVQSPHHTGASTMQSQHTGVSDMHDSTLYGSSLAGGASDHDKSPRPTSYLISSPGTSEMYAPLPNSTEVQQGAWSGEKSYSNYQSGPVSEHLYEVDGAQVRPHELDAARQDFQPSEMRG